MKNHNLNTKEEQVMLILWESDKPLSATDIANKINKDWAHKSIQNIVKKLCDLGFIEVNSIAKISKTYGRFFSPKITKEEYIKMRLDGLCGNKPALSIFLKLVDTQNNSAELAEKLQKLLDEYEEE